MLGGKGAVMTTLDDVTKKKAEQSAEQQAAVELVRLVAIHMTLSCGGIGVGAVCVGWSSALLVVVLMRSSVGWNGDSGCAPVVLFAQLSVPAHRSGPQWWRCDIGCSGVGGSEGDGDLDAADRGTVTRCRPVWALGGGVAAWVVARS